ncbi:MAG: CdaR family protein [Oscillospiraceae bacterium]
MDKKKGKSGIWNNKIFLAAISLLASVLLWVYVTTTEGDVISETYDNIPVEFKGADTLRDKEGFIISNASANTVSITLKGTRRNIAKLSASELKAFVDVSKIAVKGNYTSSFDVTYPLGIDRDSVSLVSTLPSSVSFLVDKTNTKTVELKGQFSGTVLEGYVPQPIIFEPQTVNISGPENEINKVACAWVVIERKDVDKTLKFDTEYVLLDNEGNEVELGNIVLETEMVSVTLPITATKEVPLTVDLVDGGGATIENVKISCDPATIIIAGDAETLASINKISLGTVDLAAFASTFEDKFTVVLPDKVSNVTGITAAKATVEVIGLETRKFNVTNISAINAPTGRTSSMVTENVEVTLRGSADVLNKIKANNIRVVADLTDVGNTTGVFQPIAKIYVDGFTGVGAVGEYKIYVKLS